MGCLTSSRQEFGARLFLLPGVIAAGPQRVRPRLIEIPVCYDAEFGFDLDRVAEHTKLSEREIVDLHSTREYRVACIGFVPGFTFLAGLPKNLATPRRDVPRKEIPPGSVGIGGAQTGIYPLRSPGGWNLDRPHSAEAFRSDQRSADPSVSRRSRAFSRNYAGGVCESLKTEVKALSCRAKRNISDCHSASPRL